MAYVNNSVIFYSYYTNNKWFSYLLVNHINSTQYPFNKGVSPQKIKYYDPGITTKSAAGGDINSITRIHSKLF